MKANFIVPFDPITRQTILPKDANGQSIPMDFWHLTPEVGNTVCVQVRGEDTVIEAMKTDPAYQWLEDIEEVPNAPTV